jgi:hypothetical protein
VPLHPTCVDTERQREGERASERERNSERERKKERERDESGFVYSYHLDAACVGVCVCARARIRCILWGWSMDACMCAGVFVLT